MSQPACESTDDASAIYQNWIHSQYTVYSEQLLRFLSHEEHALQVSSLHCCMDFVRISFLENPELSATNSFLIKLLKKILSACGELSSIFIEEMTATFFKAYDDLRFVFFTHVAHILGSKMVLEVNMELFLSNLINVT